MSPKRLLIVEDDEALAALLEEYLSESGYRVTVLHRGDDAIRSLDAQHFDIILTDIVMPGADGLHVLAANQEKANDTLVLLMTAYSGIEDAIHAIEQGAYDFVSKPFQLPEIRVRLDNAAKYQSLLRKWKSHDFNEDSKGFTPIKDSPAPIYSTAAIKAYGVIKE